MEKTKSIQAMVLICICLIAVWSLGQTACTGNVDDDDDDDDTGSDSDSGTDSDSDSDSDSDTDSDSDSDTDADTDSDTDTDTSECEDDVKWNTGTLLTLGNTIPNWQFSGYVDSDGNHQIEQVDVPFEMLDIYCTNKQSLVVFFGKPG